MIDFDVIIIGAGAIGLAIAAELASNHDVLVLERERTFGQGTSSRNSEVLHAGIYYQPQSLKAQLCVEGRHQIASWARDGSFAWNPLGKYIVATCPDEEAHLNCLLQRARANGVEDLRAASVDELREKEPSVKACAALFSPSTAIFDSHGMMQHMKQLGTTRGSEFLFRHELVALQRKSSSWELAVKVMPASLDKELRENPIPEKPYPAIPGEAGDRFQIALDGGAESVRCRWVINAAGLASDRIAALAGMDVEALGLRQYYSRGEYFRHPHADKMNLKHLIYPSPAKNAGGHLGIHVTLDLGGQVRFGPSAEWPSPLQTRREEFSQDLHLQHHFGEAVQTYLPGLSAEGFVPAGVGLRPRCYGPQSPARDFYIKEESARGLSGLVNLIGIESPGLTCAPAIGRYVREILGG